jgi:hypothetical protein
MEPEDALRDDRFPGTFEQWLETVKRRETLLFYDQCANVAKFLTAEIKGDSCMVSFMETSETVEWTVSSTFPLSKPGDLYRLFDETGRQSVRFDFIYPFFFSR